MSVTDPLAPVASAPALRARPRFARHGAANSALLITTLSVAAGIVAWAVASRVLDSPLFPSPARIFDSAVELTRSGMLVDDVAVSVRRIAIGFALGCLVGVPLGLAMGLFRFARALCEPIVQFLRFVPPIAWLIPAIMWFGIGEASKILLIFYMTVFLVLLNTMAGVAAMRQNHLRSADNYEVSRWQLFAWVVFPATMSYSVAGARIALGNSFAAVVGAELIAADSGLGYRIVESGKWLAMSDMFAAMLVLGLLGIAADRIVSAVTSRFLPQYLPVESHAG
jgi:NitT/TauT family transport system permease protein